MAGGKEFDYKSAQLETWDFVVLAVYFVTVLVVGVLVICILSFFKQSNFHHSDLILCILIEIDC